MAASAYPRADAAFTAWCAANPKAPPSKHHLLFLASLGIEAPADASRNGAALMPYWRSAEQKLAQADN